LVGYDGRWWSYRWMVKYGFRTRWFFWIGVMLFWNWQNRRFRFMVMGNFHSFLAICRLTRYWKCRNR